MKLSDTQRIVLSHGAQHPQLLAIAPKHLPVAACRAVVNMLRSALSRRGTRATGAPRKPREGTKQEVVLAMLRRPEGATVAQIAEATGWAQHTVRGFFAGLKKRQGITVEIAERIRQVGPNKQGAKGSYTVYRVAE